MKWGQAPTKNQAHGLIKMLASAASQLNVALTPHLHSFDIQGISFQIENLFKTFMNINLLNTNPNPEVPVKKVV